MDILGPLAALCLDILINNWELRKCPRLLLVLFFTLTSLSWAWWVRHSARNLLVDVALVEVRDRASKIDLSLAKLILVGLDQLKLSLSHPLIKSLSLTHCDTQIQTLQLLKLVTLSHGDFHDIYFLYGDAFTQSGVLFLLLFQVG